MTWIEKIEAAKLRRNDTAGECMAMIQALAAERDELQAQVAVLRMALDRARKGFVNLIDLNLLPSEEYEKDANKIAQCCFEALSDTPVDAAERVQMLVEALEEVEKMGTYKNNGTFSEDMLEEPWAVIAGNALAEWRRDKCS